VRHDLDVVTYSHRPAFSAAGDRIAFAVDAEIQIHDTRTGRLVRRLVGHEGPVEALEFAADGRGLVSGAVDRTVRTWDLGSGRSEVHAGFEGIVSEVQPLADGRSILAVSTSGEVRLFEPHRAGQVVGEHDAPATGLALSIDDRVASIDEQGQLRIAELAGPAIAGHSHAARADDPPRDRPGRAQLRRRPAGVGDDDRRPPPRPHGPARDAAARHVRREPAARILLPSAALELAWLADDVIVALVDGAVLRVDRDGTMTELDRFTGPATSVAVAPDGAWIAAGSEDGAVRLSEIATGRRRELQPHSERVTGLAFAAGGQWLGSGCADHTVRLWRLADGTFRAYDEGGHGMEQVSFSADGATLLC
jgi:WD40 repeat protein